MPAYCGGPTAASTRQSVECLDVRWDSRIDETRLHTSLEVIPLWCLDYEEIVKVLFTDNKSFEWRSEAFFYGPGRATHQTPTRSCNSSEILFVANCLLSLDSINNLSRGFLRAVIF